MKLGDDFLHIPKLDVSSSNWIIFKDCFLWSIDARGLTEHIDGTSQSPVDPVPSTVWLGLLSDGEKLLDKEWKRELKEWNQGEAIANRLATVRSWNLKNRVWTWTRLQVRGSGPAFHGTQNFC